MHKIEFETFQKNVKQSLYVAHYFKCLLVFLIIKCKPFQNL